MASSLFASACRSVPLTSPLRHLLRTFGSPRSTRLGALDVGAQKRWRSCTDHERISRTCVVQAGTKWPCRHGGQQLRYLADGGRNTDDELKKKRPSPLTYLLPHENIYTLPNILTFSRLLAAPIVGYLIIQKLHAPALGLFLYAGITDLVDGWIARRYNSQTVVGTVIDPMADKALMTVVTVCLAVKGVLPVPLAVLIVGRDILLGISALYYRYISLPHPKSFARYWDFSLPSAEVRPTTISKINTFLQLGLIGATMGGMAVGGFEGMVVGGIELQRVLEGAWWVVGGTTVWSGLSYIWGGRGVKILGRK